MLVALCFMIFSSSVLGSSKDLQAQYCQMLADYHQEPFDTVMSLVGSSLSAEEAAVVFHISERLHIDPMKVIEAHGEAGNWMATATKLGLTAVDFHVPGVDASGSETFAPIYEKFRSTAATKWREIVLDDAEILNLANLSLLLNYHRYDIDKIMSLRDKGTSYEEINAEMSKSDKEDEESPEKE